MYGGMFPTLEQNSPGPRLEGVCRYTFSTHVAPAQIFLGCISHENWMRAYLLKSPRCWILDSFKWNKHRCTYVHFEDFISSSCSHIAVQVESKYLNIPGFVISLYTHIWIDLRRHEITLRCHIINCSWIGCELLLSGIVIDEWSSHLSWSFKSF